MKTQTQIPGSPSGAPNRLGWLLLIPLLALTLPTQATGPEINIQYAGDTNAVLSWDDAAGEYIVLWASTLDGPWTPCLESIDRGTNLCQTAVCITGECKYFKLARGQRFEETDWDLAEWTIAPVDPQATNHLIWEATNGLLHVHGSWPGDGLDRHVVFLRTNLLMADFVMSIDIVGWDESHYQDMPNIVLFGRVDPDRFEPSNGYWYGYSGGVGMRYGDDPDYSCTWLTEQRGYSWSYLGAVQRFGKTDPAKDYRLQLYCVGAKIAVKVFNLTDGILADEYTASDDTLTNGWVGFWVVERGTSGTVDFWLDNFVVVGTEFLTQTPPPPPTWTLVWSDEFDGPDIDPAKWSHEVNAWGGGNNELQYYTDRLTNSFIQDGCLVIQALDETYTGPEGTRDYTSARLRTLNKGDWTYGRFEARMKLPYGQGLWPAFWMLPTDWVYGGWAASGEIDIMELVGHEPNVIHGTIHYGGEWPDNVAAGNSWTLASGDFSDDFHVFAVEWQEGLMRWYVDDIHYSTQTWWWTDQGSPFPAPFDQDFHILLNVAVGGNWPGPPDGTTVFPQQMVVDYVRVYAAEE